jgi:mannosyltransferase OCH1-like enzyme
MATPDTSGSSSSSSSSSSSTTPLYVGVRILHLSFGFFDDVMPKKMAAHVDGLRAANPDFEVRIWGPVNSRAVVAAVAPHKVPLYDAYPWAIQRSDMSRYAILHAHGGMYADLDYNFNAPLAEVLAVAHGPGAAASAFVNETPNATLFRRRASNSFMGSRWPGHPFWVTVLNATNRGSGLSRHAKVLSSAGPQAVDRALVAWRRGPGQAPGAPVVRMAPKAVFNPCSICDRNAMTTSTRDGVLAAHANGGTWNSSLSRCYNTLACEWPWVLTIALLFIGFVVALVFAVRRAPRGRPPKNT